MPMSPAERQAKFDAWKKEMIARGKVTPEALAPFESNPDAFQYIIDSQMAQSESQRFYEENKSTKTKLEADAAALQKWHAEAQQALNTANLTATQERKQREQIERLYHEGRTKMATNYTVDENTLNDLLPLAPLSAQQPYAPPPVSGPNGNGNGKPQKEVATREELFAAQLMGLKMQDQRARLANRHRQFFNEDLDNFEEMVLEADRRCTAMGSQFRTEIIDEVWKEKYNVAGKEEEIRTKQIDDIKRQEYERGRMEGLTQAALPTSAGGGAPPVPGQMGIRNLIPATEGATDSDREIVNAAVMDFRTREASRVQQQ